MIGKKIRLERIIDRNTRRTVIVPMDHGVTVGPIPGLEQVAPAANLIAEGGANAAVVHRGAAMFGHRGYGRDLGLILHLSASTSLAPSVASSRRSGPSWPTACWWCSASASSSGPRDPAASWHGRR